jgi:hypothetical protein
MRPTLLVVAPLLAIAAGCSQITYRPHVVPIVSLPKHPLPPGAKTYRLIVEGESILEPRLTAGIVVPGLDRAACETRTNVRVVVPAPGRGIVVERNGAGAPDAGDRGGGSVDVDRRRGKAAPTEDVVITVGIDIAAATAMKVKEKTSTDTVPGQADGPHPVYGFSGVWEIPQKLILATKGAGEVEAYADPGRADFFFDRDPRTHRPFLQRGTMQGAWNEAMPGLAMKATQASVRAFIDNANRLIDDNFVVHSTTIGIDLADEHKHDPRFGEAARAFDAAIAIRLTDPAGFPAKMAQPIAVWTAITVHPAGTDSGDQREAIGAAAFDVAVARFALDQLDDADRQALAAQAKGVDAERIGRLQRCIADRRTGLAAQKH